MKAFLPILALAALLVPIRTAPAIEESIALVATAAAPVAGTNEVQTLTFGGTPTGGTFKLKLGTLTTQSITWSATNATLVANIDAALERLSSVGTGGVTTAVGTMTAGIGTITVTCGGKLAKLDVPQMTVPTNALTGTSPTLAVSTTTPGVTADGRNYGKDTLCYDIADKTFYRNTSSTQFQPTWAAEVAGP